jgi:hypothetical protein
MASDEPQKSWLAVTSAECPVPAAAKLWTERSLEFLRREFGSDVLRQDVVLPSADFLTWAYAATPAEIEALVTRVCGLMGVDPATIRVELFDGSERRKEATRLRNTYTVGHYRVQDGQAVVALDSSDAANRPNLAAVIAHELGHVRLLGENRYGADRADHERLTDLLTVYLGFGVLSANAALSFARGSRGFTIIPQGQFDDRSLNAARRMTGWERLGYLSTREFGYALACYARMRGEANPAWARAVSPGQAVYLTQGLTYLQRGRTQR